MAVAFSVLRKISLIGSGGDEKSVTAADDTGIGIRVRRAGGILYGYIPVGAVRF